VIPSSRARGWRRLAKAGLTIYAIVLLITPFAHHDLLCELKTPRHCTACTSSVVSPDPSTPAVVGAWILTDAGAADTIDVVAQGALLAVHTTGRSPPAA
jgi:hypothetical protein